MSKAAMGQAGGGRVPFEWPLSASLVGKNNSGCFVKVTSGNLVIAGSGDTEILGWAEAGEATYSATAAADVLTVNVALDATYRILTDEAQTETQLKALRWKTCDLITTSNIQYADIGESTEDVIQILDYEFDGNAANKQVVIVRLAPGKIAATGVA